MAIMRRRKGGGGKRSENPEHQSDENKEKKGKESEENSKSGSANLNVNLNLNLHSGSVAKKSRKKWSCVDGCCWFIGCICSMWWFLLFLYNAMPPSFPQYVTEAITGPLPDPPGVKLAKDGLKAKHPVVFVPGIVTGGLELWEGHACAEGLFRKRLWGGTFGEVYKRPLCWVEHMSLDNETGLDPPGIKIRPVSGLVAADYFAPGYFVWAVLIANLARIGYEDKNMYMAAYDWRLSFQNTEVRDQTLSRIKSNIELMVATSGGKKVVVVPHSMGVLYFLHFMKWVEAPKPMGGGGGPNWCAEHIKAVMNIGGPFLGVPKAVSGLFSAEAKDIAIARAIAPGVLDRDVFGFQTLQHVMRMTRTWDSTMSMIPKGGDTIWGGLDWSPEEGHACSSKKNSNDQIAGYNRTEDLANSGGVKYGRIISFGKDVADLRSSDIGSVDFRGAFKGNNLANITCRDVWTEYHDMGIGGIKAVADYKVYTAGSILDLLHFVAPKMMKRGGAHFSYGIADDLSDKKYEHFKYWSNPLETTLPNAPDMEIFSMYGVGIPTERAYVYKFSPAAECFIPFQIDTSVDGADDNHCLQGGVYSVDGDETVPVLSAGFMSAKGWRGKTRFNPSGIRTFLREYNHAPPTTLLEGRGTQSGAHVDIMGNFALIEDIIRVAAGATGEEIGGDKVHSDIFKWSERIKLRL
ncbi:phospholipid:diacylglycerol acyltransferase 1 isoform X1 [Sesamum indicum]|uniref:phospholipid:diacylglycerol acyltransferase n=1 Tax=Sesamum indicum TaxID=4182 RepID=A0A6I9U8K1_SESIN|nr:phospholipid:diacylglycerol acyltransferase 1 isoform X1 [Sesamum indicum]XP_011093788.1 phospholipid:diacylglycerol acyltransferase 1 isoform X1 [Sesamum indicum]XP_020553630.1 phospholipid:diacylglycerol acyltransferase 1 isoform X1 [Sesamum indicum]